jgi:hypothetical protein
MSKRSWLGLVVASFVMTASGAAFSGNATLQNPVELVGFDESSEVLDGIPPGQAGAQAYLHTDQTEHLASPPINQFPNNPCRGFAIEWNRQVDLATDRGIDLETRQSFRVLLTHMAEASCSTAISSDLSQNPAPIVSISPTP